MDRWTPVNSKDRAREERPCYVTVTLTTSDKLSNARRIEVESRRYKVVEAAKNCISVFDTSYDQLFATQHNA